MTRAMRARSWAEESFSRHGQGLLSCLGEALKLKNPEEVC
jgi:hypothetical protein